VPGIHALAAKKAVDGRDKPGHDGEDALESTDHLKRQEVTMPQIWIGLNSQERKILLKALKVLRPTDGKRSKKVDTLTAKLVHSAPHPQITVGVHGGQIQWTLGNPFPIRVCDYDGDREELPDIDERGQRCRIWFEPRSNDGRV
jgi:hypothetical protein